MADITRLSRFVGGLPRDVDMSTNTLQVSSLKVGSISPTELTKSLVDLLVTINTTGLPSANLSAGAKQSTLESKLAAFRVGVLNYSAAGSSDDVSTQVLAVATTDTAIGAGSGISAAAAKGIFVGTVSGATDVGKVLIRAAGTDNGIDDGTGDEVFGVISESGGVYTLSYKTASNSAFTMPTSTAIDFYFAEVMDLFSFGVDRLLMPAIGGVVDATAASAIFGEQTARQNADSTLQSNINIEITARQNADSTLQSSIDGEITARSNADSTLQSNINIEITARQNADSTLQSAIDSEITARSNADSTLQSNINIEITARQNADSTLQSSLNSEITARTNADSTLQSSLNSEITARTNADSSLQSELDLTQGSLGSAISGTGGWLGFSGTNYLNAELTISNSLKVLDSRNAAEVTARSNADSTLQSSINAEITARINADSTLQSQISAVNASKVDTSFIAATGGISAGDVVALSLTVAGEVIKANASAIATCESIVGVATETKTAGNAVLIRTYGEATVTTEAALDIGKRVYAHTVAGQSSKTAPSSVNNVVYVLGGATATTKVFVNPKLEYVVA